MLEAVKTFYFPAPRLPLAYEHVFAAETSAGGRHGLPDDGLVMKRFGYWRDPLFLTACELYALNRWLVKPHVHSPFLRGQFNDCLLIPAALPLVLWLQRRLWLRRDDEFPSAGEIGFHLIVWSLVCEGIGPYLLRGTGDFRDVVAYTGGAVFAWLWWRGQKQTSVRGT
jgi:hypothetical protein